ncbi:MAG: (E)-4-hydroxy-3-methylbut-2-enyl-diphosphate synthase [Bacteroidales bacterium]|jgi:(E)-4-hydroxy-3-methylbut-2-enyl-diphosphate synthase|nr:(E)-4-hydroxy-3-methylbut-2-enyl-diphosphate synthase [Bacteroidales bacterium]
MRRHTQSVNIGGVFLGSEYPVRLQSMVNTDTMNTKATVAQAIRIVEAGGDYVRITAPGVREAEQLAVIKKELNRRGYRVPLIADIHFNPKAAETAARLVEKVRINPGNYFDKRTIMPQEYSESEYTAELERMHERILPLIAICKEYGTAVRIGSNHGSLSNRIVHRYGDAPKGMVESVMEFLRIFEAEQFRQVVISMKASNVRVMIDATRLLVAQMEQEQMNYPVHLGVTEAGDGEDGRIKSALGIGTLLLDGIGDTIRVSLTEAPENELPVAKKIVQYVNRKANPIFPTGETEGEIVWKQENFRSSAGKPVVVLKREYQDTDAEDVCVKAACDFGAHLLNGIGDGILVATPALNPPEKGTEIALALLQACRLRMSKTEYISCPSCGRTLFDLQTTVARIKEKTSHLKGLKIAVMGCIVNGPGEMADADYGYVGAGEGKVTLYRRREVMKSNIPEGNAVEELINLIKNNGDWKEMPTIHL